MIQFKDISKTFKTKTETVHALQHVSLTIEDGDLVVPVNLHCFAW